MIKLSRAFISGVLKDFAAPSDRQDATYGGPNFLSDSPVQVVADPFAGGLVVRDRIISSTTGGIASSFDFAVLQVPADREYFIRAWELVCFNQGGVDRQCTDWSHRIADAQNTINVRLTSGKIVNVGAGDTLNICPFNFDVNLATGAATWGMEGVLANPGFRLAANEVWRFTAEWSGSVTCTVRYVVDDVPKGITIVQ